MRPDSTYPVCQDVYDLASPEQRQYLVVRPDEQASGTRGYQAARGVLPWSAGDELPEDTLRRGRGGDKQSLATPRRRAKKPGDSPAAESEADFASWLEDFLHVHGYKFAHFRPARVMRNGKETYETPVSGNAKGLPDYYVWHPERRPHLGFRESAFWVELKSATGKLSEAQIECIKSLRASGAQVFIWRPDDRDEIERLLR